MTILGAIGPGSSGALISSLTTGLGTDTDGFGTTTGTEVTKFCGASGVVAATLISEVTGA